MDFAFSLCLSLSSFGLQFFKVKIHTHTPAHTPSERAAFLFSYTLRMRTETGFVFDRFLYMNFVVGTREVPRIPSHLLCSAAMAVHIDHHILHALHSHTLTHSRAYRIPDVHTLRAIITIYVSIYSGDDIVSSWLWMPE